jgi:saccharopine dehydrogenase (NAD+, L-lysine-forming)
LPAALVAAWNSPTQLEFVLGGRDARALSQLAHELDMDFIQFGLDDRARVVQVLQSFNLVINAAGPFIGTGEKLAKVAIETGTHYVDINGEVAVYKRLDDLAAAAERRNVTLVSGAGTTAAVSDVMLDVALKTIENDIAQPELGESAHRHLAHGILLAGQRAHDAERHSRGGHHRARGSKKAG